MTNNDTFLPELENLVKEKSQWYDAVELPRLLQCYKKEHQDIVRLSDCLVQRRFMQEDPYKNEKMITSISDLDNSPIFDADISSAIGIRLSDFERILDYVCTSFKFSIESFTTATARQFLALNSFFAWSELGNSEANNTTKAFSMLLSQIRRSGDAVCITVASDSIAALVENVAEMNRILAALVDFQREVAKMQIRKALAEQPLYSPPAIGSPAAMEFEKIRSFFMTKKIVLPFTIQNIQEIVFENVAPDALERRHALFQKLAVSQPKAKQKKKATPREVAMTAISLLGGLSDPFSSICQKILANAKVLKLQDANFFSNFVDFLKRLFGIREEPTEYRVRVVAKGSATSHLESIVVDEFLAELQKRANFYLGFSSPNSKNYAVIAKCDDEKLCDFLRKQIAGCRKLAVLLDALNVFFKENIRASERMNLRGFKIEIVAVSNVIYKMTNFYHEALSLIE